MLNTAVQTLVNLSQEKLFEKKLYFQDRNSDVYTPATVASGSSNDTNQVSPLLQSKIKTQEVQNNIVFYF